MKSITKRNKPRFLRQGWHKFHRLGKHVKKRRVWRAAKGGDSKQRLRERGKSTRPTIGWGSNKAIRGKVAGLIPIRVENITEMEKLSKGQGVIIGSVGRKLREQLIKMANEKGFKILNRYRSANATK